MRRQNKPIFFDNFQGLKAWWIRYLKIKKQNIVMVLKSKEDRILKNKKTKYYYGLKNQRGVAYVEMLPLLVIFVLLFGLSFGLWTSIHRATLKSIAARHYSFEVLNNRTHYVYHKDIQDAVNYKQYYRKNGKRFFANVDYQDTTKPDFWNETTDLTLFNQGITKISDPSPENSANPQTNPIRIKIGYGICIDTKACDLE